MELKAGYKNTEIGVIPVDWEIENIDDVLKISTGSKNTQDKLKDGKYPFFVRSQTIERINSYAYDCEAVLTAGDGVGTGKIFHYVNGKFELHQRVYIMNNFKKNLLGHFFFLYFSNNFYNRVMQMTAKSSVDSVRREMIAEMQIPLPPLPEQTAIANVLSDTDKLLQALEKKISKKRLIKQGAMQELMKPKEGWVVKSLGEVCDFHKGKGLPKSEIIENGKYKCIHYGELFTKYKESIVGIISRTNTKENCFYSRKNDVLMPTSDVTPNGLATASCINEDIVTLGGDILVIRSSIGILNGIFLSYFIAINRAQVMQLVTGSTVYHLYGSDMARFIISYPPLEEQTQISTILSDMDTEIESLEKQLAKYKQVKQGLMQNLLTGKIRLV